MRVKNDTLLFGTVMEKENYEKTVKMSFFFKSIENNT